MAAEMVEIGTAVAETVIIGEIMVVITEEEVKIKIKDRVLDEADGFVVRINI